MFSLNKEVNRLQQLQHNKIYGLSYRPKQHNPKVSHIDGTIYEMQAIQEGLSIPRSFHNHSKDFGKRLRKSKGEYHRPGGGFAGHTIKGDIKCIGC